MRHKAALLPQVTEAGLRAAVAAGQQPGTEEDHADNRYHLDDGEPELRFTVQSHVDQVDQINQHKKDRCGDPGRDVRPPILNINPYGR
ncbi:hypothetical protein D3C79_967340 [compost metagenome]